MKRGSVLLLGLLALIMGACSGSPSAMPVGAVPTIAQLPTVTDTATSPPIDTATPRPTSTATVSPTASDTPNGTPSNTPTVTPSATITDTPTLLPSPTPTVTLTTRPMNGLDMLGQLARQTTITPLPRQVVAPLESSPRGSTYLQPLLPSYPSSVGVPDLGQNAIPTPLGNLTAAGNCSPAPESFGNVESRYPEVNVRLGCAVGAPTGLGSAYQTYEQGFMIWAANPNGGAGTIYTVYNSGGYQSFTDTWRAGVDPDSGGETAPDGLIAPIRGFGKVWRENIGVRNGLGWATSSETGDNVTLLLYERGLMLLIPQRGEMVVFGADGTWFGVPY